MAPGSDDEEAEGDDGPPRRDGPPDERVLAPEELDFTEDEKVEQLDEGKFVIGTDSEPDIPPEERETAPGSGGGAIPDRSPEPERTPDPEPDPAPTEPEPAAGEPAASQSRSGPRDLTGREVKDFISEELRRTESKYAYRIAAKTDDTVSHQQLASDDIGMAFDGLLMWYAQQVGADTSVEEALGILLAKSNIRIRYPTKLLTAYLRQHDLGPDDDIASLLAAIRTEDGLVFPPDTR